VRAGARESTAWLRSYLCATYLAFRHSLMRRWPPDFRVLTVLMVLTVSMR
jgi:hypothetical protein